MLGIVFIYYIGKSFHTLTEEHNKNPWLWAILGVLSYYAGSIILGVLVLFALIFLGLDIDLENIDKVVDIIVSLIAGLSSCGAFYFILKHQWSKKVRRLNDLDNTILDDI